MRAAAGAMPQHDGRARAGAGLARAAAPLARPAAARLALLALARASRRPPGARGALCAEVRARGARGPARGAPRRAWQHSPAHGRRRAAARAAVAAAALLAAAWARGASALEPASGARAAALLRAQAGDVPRPLGAHYWRLHHASLAARAANLSASTAVLAYGCLEWCDKFGRAYLCGGYRKAARGALGGLAAELGGAYEGLCCSGDSTHGQLWGLLRNAELPPRRARGPSVSPLLVLLVVSPWNLWVPPASAHELADARRATAGGADVAGGGPAHGARRRLGAYPRSTPSLANLLANGTAHLAPAAAAWVAGIAQLARVLGARFAGARVLVLGPMPVDQPGTAERRLIAAANAGAARALARARRTSFVQCGGLVQRQPARGTPVGPDARGDIDCALLDCEHGYILRVRAVKRVLAECVVPAARAALRGEPVRDFPEVAPAEPRGTAAWARG